MFFSAIFLGLLSTLLTMAASLSSSPTQSASDGSNKPGVALTTPPPSLPYGTELRKRQDRAKNCGYSDTLTWTCNNQNAFCAATIFDDGNAWQYCGTRGAAEQPIFTTYIANWPSSKTCPKSAGCCVEPSPAVVTELYIAERYTVTGYYCNTEPGTVTLVPDKNVLNPPSFSASLAEATAPSKTHPSTPTDPSRKHGGDDDSSGLSTGAKVGIGAGVGGAVGLLLICGIVWFCLRRSKKNKGQVAEIQPAQPHHNPPAMYNPPPMQSPQGSYPPSSMHSPQGPYQPAMSYVQADPKYSYHQPESHTLQPPPVSYVEANPKDYSHQQQAPLAQWSLHELPPNSPTAQNTTTKHLEAVAPTIERQELHGDSHVLKP